MIVMGDVFVGMIFVIDYGDFDSYDDRNVYDDKAVPAGCIYHDEYGSISRDCHNYYDDEGKPAIQPLARCINDYDCNYHDSIKMMVIIIIMI